MSTVRAGAMLRHVQRLAGGQALRGLADADLLLRFTASGDESAFSELLRRHGNLVWATCRRVTRFDQEAEDVFQATFLVLARKANAIRKGQSLASWLYGVAYRVAVRMNQQARQRRACEERYVTMAATSPITEASWRELQAILDEELNRLPEKYRAPFVLCHLDGKSREEAARELGLKDGTLSSRLAQARKSLRQRLTRRGALPAAILSATALAARPAKAAIPRAVLQATSKAALLFAAGSETSLVSTAVVSAAKGVLKTMAISNLKITSALILSVALIGLSASFATVFARAQDKPEPEKADDPAAHSKAVGAKSSEKRVEHVDSVGDPLPDGAVRRLGTLRFRQGGGQVNRLLLSPDGKTLISKSYYGERSVAVWEFPSGKLIRQFPGHYYDNRAVALSPDGKTLALGQGGEILFFDLASGRKVGQLKSLAGEIGGLAFSPDGKMIASGNDGREVLLWDLGKEKVQARLPAEHNHPMLLIFSPDGKTLATGGPLGSTIRLFDVPTLTERHLIKRPTDVLDFSFSPDGAALAVGARDGVISLWDPIAGNLIREVHSPNKYVHAVAWSPDGKILAANDLDQKENRSYIRLWDPATGKERRHIQGHSQLCGCLAFTADGKTLISGGSDSIIRLWDPATCEERPSAAGNQLRVFWFALSPDGKTLAYSERDAIHLLDMATGREDGKLPGFHWSFTFSPDGRILAGGIDFNIVNLWNVADRLVARRLEVDPKEAGLEWVRPHHVAFSPDGRVLASANDELTRGDRSSRDSVIRLWDLVTEKEMRRLPIKDSMAKSGTVESLAFSPDGRTLVASGRGLPKLGKVRLWEAASGKELTEQETAINGSLVATDESKILHWNVEPRIVFSPDGRLLAMNKADNGILVWEAITGGERCRLEGHGLPAVCVAFAPDGRTLASAGFDHTIRLWDVETGKELKKLTGHRGKANALAFTPDSKTLISAGDDTTVLFWDMSAMSGRKRVQEVLTVKDWNALWEDLAGADGVKAHQAMARLAASSELTTVSLKNRLQAAPKADATEIDQFVRDLDADEFTARQKASAELERLEDAAKSALESAYAKEGASAEMRRQIERLLEALAVPAGNRLRDLRAVEVLEHIATPEAKQVLNALAKGASSSILTRESQAAIARLNQRY